MAADTRDELVAMLYAIGFDESKIRYRDTSIEQCVVSLTRRQAAIKYGAKSVSEKDLTAYMTKRNMKAYRKPPNFNKLIKQISNYL